MLFERLNLEKNIQTYEDLLLKKQSVKENVVFIEQMLQKLYNQKIWIENKIKSIQEDNETINNYNDIQAVNLNLNSNVNANVKNANVNVNANANVKDITNMKPIVRKSINSPNESAIFRLNNVSKIIPKKFLSKEEVRSNALNEIFYFYSRQHQLTSRIATFDDIANKTDRMDLGEFMKFCCWRMARGAPCLAAHLDAPRELAHRQERKRQIRCDEPFGEVTGEKVMLALGTLLGQARLQSLPLCLAPRQPIE